MADAYTDPGRKLDGPPAAPPGQSHPAPMTSMSSVAPATPSLGPNAFPQAIAEQGSALVQGIAEFSKLTQDVRLVQLTEQLHMIIIDIMQKQGATAPTTPGAPGMSLGAPMNATPTPGVGAGGPPMV